jgi:hypothetical protein
MNIKWVVDGVSDYCLYVSFSVLRSGLAFFRLYVREDSAQHRVCVPSPSMKCPVRTLVAIGLIKQLADVGTALS